MAYRILYNVLIHLALPVVLLVLYWPKKGKLGFAKRWPEHWGWVGRSRQPAPLWIHAVSVGETLAISPLIRALKAERPDLPIILTTTTRTGAEQANKLGDLVEHRYAPLDYPWAVAAFLTAIKPRALWLMETELWPNWLAACQARRLPVTVINGRLSERSCLRYRRFQRVFDGLSAPISRILCQHSDDAERFARLGISADRLAVTGSIKFDISFADTVYRQGQALRQQLGVSRPVWIAASTHQGEDEQLLAAFSTLLTLQPQALLILVPRHPERFSKVAQLCAPYGCVTRTSTLPFSEQDKIYLGDTMGELPVLLAAADVVFIGGSLISRGGHNLLEPAALAKPCLIGPNYFNFSDITRQLVAQGGCHIVQDSAQLAGKLSQLFSDSGLRRQMGEQARAVVLRNQGALARTLSQCLAELELS